MKQEFKKELKALLLKYNASIDYEFDSCHDTHCLGKSGMAICIDGKTEFEFPYETRITAHDIK